MISLLDGSRDRAQVISAAGDRGIPPHWPSGCSPCSRRAARWRIFPPVPTGRCRGSCARGSHRSSRPRPRARRRRRRRARPRPAARCVRQRPRRRAARVGRRSPDCLRDRPGHQLRRLRAGAGGEPLAGARPDLVVADRNPCPGTGREPDARPDTAPGRGGEAIGVVGPLVIPGRSACLRCLDLARTDRDPAWPLILAQMAGRRPDPPACDATLAAAVAAQATAQAMAFVDRPGRTGPVSNGTLELVLPAWQWRRRTWLPHPACTCGQRAAG